MSPSGHKITGLVNFNNIKVYPDPENPITIGLHFESGHSDFHDLMYDIGAVRQNDSNRMIGFIDEFHFKQSHEEPLDGYLAQRAGEAIIEERQAVNQRFRDAQEQKFLNEDEALVVLTSQKFRLDHFFDKPTDVLGEHLQIETSDDGPTLYDTYQAATTALTHTEVPEYRRDQGMERAAWLLETGDNQVPDADLLASEAIENRIYEINENPNLERYWPDEENTLKALIEERGINYNPT